MRAFILGSAIGAVAIPVGASWWFIYRGVETLTTAIPVGGR